MSTEPTTTWAMKHMARSEIPQKGPHKDKYVTESRAGNRVVTATFAEAIQKLAKLEGTEADIRAECGKWKDKTLTCHQPPGHEGDCVWSDS